MRLPRRTVLAAVLVSTALLRARTAPSAKPPGVLPVPAAVLASLQAGDLVFREGTELVSEAVRAMDRGGYSHVGLLTGVPDHWQVLHAVPAERADRSDGVVVDDLDFYLDGIRARRAGFYRVEASATARAQVVGFAQRQLGRPFRLDPQEGTYCTELIWAAYRHAEVDLDVQFSRLQLPLLSGHDLLLPSALRASPRLRLLHATPSRPHA